MILFCPHVCTMDGSSIVSQQQQQQQQKQLNLFSSKLSNSNANRDPFNQTAVPSVTKVCQYNKNKHFSIYLGNVLNQHHKLTTNTHSELNVKLVRNTLLKQIHRLSRLLYGHNKKTIWYWGFSTMDFSAGIFSQDISAIG